MAKFSTLSASLLALAAIGQAHTPSQVDRELLLRRTITQHSKRLEKCASSPAAIALKERAIARRVAKAQEIREKRGLLNHKMHRRDLDDLNNWLTVDHDMSDLGYTLDTPAADLFDTNATCTLVPEETIGPYYVAGELIRTDLTDGQSGVPIHLDIQFLDIDTCEGVSDLLIDVWHCNSTGVYSGVAATGQGGLDTTHGRGVQASDSDGVVQFDTLYPGHYTGRTNHIHVMSTADATQFDNGTFTGGTARHIGQMYFESSLTTEVEALEPYSTNTQEFTDNTSDSLAAAEATDEFDPFLKFVRLGDSLQDGLLMWIAIGIDTSADYSDQVSAAANYYEDGGVANENSGMGGGPGGAPPSGGLPPSGGIPSATSGVPPASTVAVTAAANRARRAF